MKALLALLSLLLMAGCVTPRISKDGLGRPQDAADLAPATIVKGKTTKREVLDRLGPPDQMMDGARIPSARAAAVWTYETIYTSEYGGDVDLFFVGASSSTDISEKSYLILYFDRRDIVTHYVAKPVGPNRARSGKKP